MTDPFEPEDRSAFAPKADGAYKRIASKAANRELEKRPRLNFMWTVMMLYGLLFAFSLVICLGNMTYSGPIRLFPFLALFGLLLLSCLAVYYLSKRFEVRIERLTLLTKRIATGDFSPILPISRYRDEFTAVNVAMNRMLEELDVWCTVMEESHQLTAIGTLTAGVAHEINNPLNNIMLTVLTLQEDYKDLTEDEREEMIRDLVQETERAQQIVRNLQDFARESESASGVHDLGVLVEETAKLAVNQARFAGAKISMNIRKHLPCIRGDRQKLKQVFINLILNALDAAGKEGEIKISVEKGAHPGFLSVHVEDNGPGIPPHILPYIFDPFFTTKPPGKRTGLGLSVSQGIVTQHGGRIDVNNQEGKHTRFTVLIPSTDASSDQCRSNVSPALNESIPVQRS
jgi:signal transduction histidine kinase